MVIESVQAPHSSDGCANQKRVGDSEARSKSDCSAIETGSENGSLNFGFFTARPICIAFFVTTIRRIARRKKPLLENSA